MSAIERALERARSVKHRTEKWVPDHMDYPGRLVVGFRNVDSGNVERIERIGNNLVFRDYGHMPDGSVSVSYVRDRELAKRASAALDVKGPERDELITETFAVWRERVQARAAESRESRVKRGRV